MKRILLTGQRGQIGGELSKLLTGHAELLALDSAQLDLADVHSIASQLREWRPDIVINAAAYTAVDQAEADEARALAINGLAPGILAEECKRLGALLLHYSTDYVFDGRKETPYIEDDPTAPLNAYGRSKLAGETAIREIAGRHLILRTSWVYGLTGHNFLLTMLKLASERQELRVVSDQIGVPNWSYQLAEATARLIDREVEGLYHLSAGGETSWFGFAKAIIEQTHHLRDSSPTLVGIPSSSYPLPAARPRNSKLSNAALTRDTGITLPEWNTSLSQCLDALR